MGGGVKKVRLLVVSSGQSNGRYGRGNKYIQAVAHVSHTPASLPNPRVQIRIAGQSLLLTSKGA